MSSRRYVFETLTAVCCFTEEAMATIYKAEFVSLHVRKSNRAAIGLYRDTLGFTVHATEAKYCKHFYLCDLWAVCIILRFTSLQMLTEKTL